ncbi:uncharacterized protein LOC143289985 [Babylonia areolata]|uniref:uncharacterized protein LOC143289985 n=1 Tax=Babylonia areolata TaxID=304850 RepID=UPI003FD01B34
MDMWKIVLSLWLLSSVPPTHGKTRIEDCTSMKEPYWFHGPNGVKLCHNLGLRNKGVGLPQCSDPDHGIVMNDLEIAPLSIHSECGLSPSNGTFLDARCLREAVDNVTQFDAAVFDLLEKVSGKNMIRYETVDRISFTTFSSSRGNVQVKEDSSAFVAFNKWCEPVRPATQGRINNLVKICSNMQVTSVAQAYLVLDKADHGQVTHSPSLCRCTLRSTHTLDIHSLDIRLQDVTSRVCHSGVSLRIRFQNGTTTELMCEGLAARYGGELLYSGLQEVTIDLVVSAGAFPSAVWMLARGLVRKVGDVTVDETGVRRETDGITLGSVNVSCEEIIAVLFLKDDREEGEKKDCKGNSTTQDSQGLVTGLAVGLAVALLLDVALAVIVWLCWRGWNLPDFGLPWGKADGTRWSPDGDSSGCLPSVIRRDPDPQLVVPRRLPSVPARSAEMTASGYTETVFRGGPAPQRAVLTQERETSFTNRVSSASSLGEYVETAVSPDYSVPIEEPYESLIRSEVGQTSPYSCLARGTQHSPGEPAA